MNWPKRGFGCDHLVQRETMTTCREPFLVNNMAKSMICPVYRVLQDYLSSSYALKYPTCLHDVAQDMCNIHAFLLSKALGCDTASFWFGLFGQKKSKIITVSEALETLQGAQKRFRAKGCET